MAEENGLGGGSRLRRVSFAAGLQKGGRNKPAREEKPESRAQYKMACEINHAIPVSQPGPERKRGRLWNFFDSRCSLGQLGWKYREHRFLHDPAQLEKV